MVKPLNNTQVNKLEEHQYPYPIGGASLNLIGTSFHPIGHPPISI